MLNLGQNKSIQQTIDEGLLCIYVGITQEGWLLADSQQFQRVNSSIKISVLHHPLDLTSVLHTSTTALCHQHPCHLFMLFTLSCLGLCSLG